MLTCEILINDRTAMRGVRLLNALNKAAAQAGVNAKITDHYSGKHEWLMLYGPGGMEGRYQAFNEHIASGRRAVAWDMGYWARERMMRVSIDALHPQEWIWRKELSPERIAGCALPFRNAYNPDGPIVVAGMGKKSKKIYGEWDEAKMQELASRFPDKQIIFRPKPEKSAKDKPTPISSVMDGASLVVTHHSNVTIDALIAGIPFECEDGAAKAYRGDRDAFLRQLAWFQWKHEEAAEAWKFLRELTGE